MKNTHYRLFVLVSLISAFSSLNVMAQPSEMLPKTQTNPNGEELTISKILPIRQAEMARLDTNGNKQLEITELEATIPGKFASMDLNHDKVLDDAELGKYIQSFQAQYAGIYGSAIDVQVNRLIRHFKNMDTYNGGNSDGKISYAEFVAYMKEHYSEMDRNQDSIISPSEFKLDSEKL